MKLLIHEYDQIYLILFEASSSLSNCTEIIRMYVELRMRHTMHLGEKRYFFPTNRQPVNNTQKKIQYFFMRFSKLQTLLSLGIILPGCAAHTTTRKVIVKLEYAPMPNRQT